MPRRLHRHPRALSDAEEAAVYIGQDSPTTALRFLDALEATPKNLVKTPEIGNPRKFELSEFTGLRSFPVKGFEKHLIIYRTREHGIEVLRVLHGARDLGAIFDE